MSMVAIQKLTMRLVPSEGDPDAQVFDDLIRLVRQAVVTAPPQVGVPTATGEFRKAEHSEQSAVVEFDSKVKHRIEQASAASRPLVEARADKVAHPESESQLAEEALEAASSVITAVQRAMIRGLRVSVPA